MHGAEVFRARGAVVRRGRRRRQRLGQPVERLEVGRDQPERLLPRNARIANRRVARVIHARVLVQPRIGHLQRPVRRRVGRVREERFAILTVRIDVRDQLLRIEIGRIEHGRAAARAARLARLPRLHVAAVLGVVLRAGGLVREVIGRRAAEQHVAALEAPLVRRLPAARRAADDPRTDMPLAGHVRVIAGVLQQLRDRQRAVVQVALVAGQPAPLVGRHAHRAFADEMVIGAGNQHRARNGAHGARMMIRQDAPRLHERVEVRRADLAAERVDVGIAEIVGHDVQDVRALCRRSRVHLRRRTVDVAAARRERQRAGERGADQADAGSRLGRGGLGHRGIARSSGSAILALPQQGPKSDSSHASGATEYDATAHGRHRRDCGKRDRRLPRAVRADAQECMK